MQYLEFPPHEQRAFLYHAKNKLGYTWNQFSQSLNVHRQMIYFYANETCRLPLHKYNIICQRIGQQPKKHPTVFISNKLKTVRLPSLNEDLAELLGIIAGDGHLSEHTYELCIALDKHADQEYVPYITSLIQQLFCTKSTVSYQKNVARVKVYSKTLFTYLHDRHSAPIGNKRNAHRIPSLIWSRKLYLSAFLRGLFDTDGSFHRHRPTDAAVEYTSADSVFLQQVVDALQFLGIRATRSHRNAYVYSNEHIHRFFARVGTSHPKHKLKYSYFCSTGTVPLVTATA